jgi:hypothetical protein
MSDSVTYPSAEFPAPVGVSLPRPAGWEVLTVAEALVAIGKSLEGAQEFQPNVVVTSRRAIGATLEETARATVEALQSAPDWEETGQEFRDAFGGGHRSFRIEGAFTHPQVGTLYQAALITVIQRGAYTDVVQAVGSCTAGQALECLPEIRDALQGATISA